MMTQEVYVWWAALSAVSVFNIAAWVASARWLARHGAGLPAEQQALRRLQLLLAAGYVFGCAWRSLFPVFDVPRLALFDTPLASAFVGRSVATVAELCFAAQWALILRESARRMDSGFARVAARQIVPLIAIAEICSWYSVLTTSNLGHVFEETLWGFCAVLVVASLAAFWPRCTRSQRPMLALWGVAGLGYIAYMFAVDVPMYWQRWLADEANGRVYLGLLRGVADASGRWVVSTDWGIWKHEAVWMSLYFSVGVWISIGLVHVPVLQGRGPRAATRPQRIGHVARTSGTRPSR